MVVFVLFLDIVHAAPAPWGIAINDETKECAGHWPGDEYVAYSLRSGWKAYFPNYADLITIAYGTCRFRKSTGDPPG